VSPRIAALVVFVLASQAVPIAAETASSCPCALDERTLAAATAVAAAHRRADLLARKDPLAAAQEIRQALALAFPPGADSRLLRADLSARLSELLLTAGKATEALDAARKGLAEEQGQAPSALTAQLRLREGAALEALGQDAAAMDAYEEAIRIGKQLLAERAREER
jgi:tetratricopeptide (TPR) repeat protein